MSSNINNRRTIKGDSSDEDDDSTSNTTTNSNNNNDTNTGTEPLPFSRSRDYQDTAGESGDDDFGDSDNDDDNDDGVVNDSDDDDGEGKRKRRNKNKNKSNNDSDDSDVNDDSYPESNQNSPAQQQSQSKKRSKKSKTNSGKEQDVTEDASEDYIEDEGAGEYLADNAEADYTSIPALDTYDANDLDDREFRGMGREERERAEEVMARREERARGLERILDGGEGEDEELRSGRRKRFSKKGKDDDEDVFNQNRDDDEYDSDKAREEEAKREEEDESADDLNLSSVSSGGASLREFLSQDKTRRKIEIRFWRFLDLFFEGDGGDDDGNDPDDNDENNDPGVPRRKKKRKNANQDKTPHYHQKIKQMCSNNQTSLEVSYMHLSSYAPELSNFLSDMPTDILALLNVITTQFVLKLYPKYTAISTNIKVRITHLPICDSLRDLRQQNLNYLIKIAGVVTRRTGVTSQLNNVIYDCLTCGFKIGPFKCVDGKESRPSVCPNCQRSPAFCKINEGLTTWDSIQRITLQETPGTVPPGRVPRTKECLLSGDLIDRARPGEEIDVTGVYVSGSVNVGMGFPTFSTFIKVNYVLKKEDISSALTLSEADKATILALSRDPNITARIIDSIAPSIYGHKHVKTSIALALFSGVPKNISNKHRIRGDINVLLLGDPGTAKSQILKYAEKTAPRAVYSTGKGASAVGLTAAVRKDPITREWTLEGGALVLADKGLCLIDEFDKMNEGDRVSIHEAMEQQSLSISKAGIVTSLQARCSVIAAANPIGGRYDSSVSLSENVELTDPILQRFDLLCVLQDVVDPVADELLARFVSSSHMRSTPTSQLNDIGNGASTNSALEQQQQNTTGNAAGIDHDSSKDLLTDTGSVSIPQSTLRKYIQYARTFVHPKLLGFDQDKVSSLYVALRQASAQSGGVPIAVRHIESIMRLSEASARMHLREFVREDDVDLGIKVMLTSFIESQKFSVRRSLTKGFRKYLNTNSDKNHLLLHTLQKLVKDQSNYLIAKRQEFSSIQIHVEDLTAKAKELGVFDVTGFLESKEFAGGGYRFVKEEGVIVRNGGGGGGF